MQSHPRARSGATWSARSCGTIVALIFICTCAAVSADETDGVIRVFLPDAAPASASIEITSDREPARRWSAPLGRGDGATVSGLPAAVYHATVAAASGSHRATLDVPVAAGEIVSLAVRIDATGAGDWRLVIADRSWAIQGMRFAGPALHDVPAGSGLPGLVDAMAPFLIGDRWDTGGLSLGRSQRVGSRGASWTTASLRFGDVKFLDAAVPDDRLATVPDLDAFDAVIVGSGAATPDVETPGPILVLAPKRPGAARHGAFDAAFTPSGFVSTNSTATTPSIGRLDSWKSVDAGYGTPLGPRDGLFVSGGAFGIDAHDRDRPSKLSSSVGNAQAHFIANRGERTQLRVLGRFEGVKRPYAPLDFLSAPLPERDRFVHLQASGERQTVSGARLLVEGAFQHAELTPDAGELPQVTMDRVTDGLVPGPIDDNHATRSEVRAELALPDARHHAVSAGLLLAHASSASNVVAAPPVAELVAGMPARLWIPDLPSADSHRSATHFAFYLNDTIQARPDLTANVGVRLQVSRGSADGDTTRFPWHAALPRASIRWAPRLLTVFGSYGRYQQELPLSLLAFGDPGDAVTRVYRWEDANGNGSFDPGEAGPLVALAGRGPDVASANSSLKAPHTDEVTFGAERHLGDRLVLGVTGSIRREHSILRSVNVGAPLSSYTPVTVLDQGQDYEGAADDRLLTIYDRSPESFGQDRYLLTNVADDVATYEGLEITWAWASARWWTTGGASALRTEAAGGNLGFRSDENDQGVVGEVFEDPNATTNARGRLFFDRGYAMKLASGFQAPHGIHVAISARYEDGQPFARLVVAPDLAQGPALVQAYENGRTRFMFFATIDARIEKWFTVGRRRAALRLDVFNLTNLDNEVEENPLTGVDFRRTTAVQPPRAVRLGFHVDF